MATVYVAGHKTFTQGLALVCCKLAKYTTKHNATLQKYLTPAQYACIGSIASCLTVLCNLKNKSAA